MTTTMAGPIRGAASNPATSPAQRLQTTTAAVRVSFTWFGVRKTLTPTQKSQAAETFGAEGHSLSAAKKLLDTRCSAFRAVTTVKNRIVAFWKGMSLPYPDPGIRLIRQDRLQRFNDEMAELQRELAEAAAELDRQLPQLRKDAQDRLVANAQANVDSTVRTADSILSQIDRLQAELSKAAGAAGPTQPLDQLRANMRKLWSDLESAQKAVPPAKEKYSRAMSALEDKSRELAAAKEAADQARSRCEADFRSARFAQAEADKAAKATTAALEQSLGALGQAVRDSGATSPAISAPLAEAGELTSSIQTTENEIVFARSRTESARGGWRRFTIKAGASVVIVLDASMIQEKSRGRTTTFPTARGSMLQGSGVELMIASSKRVARTV